MGIIVQKIASGLLQDSKQITEEITLLFACCLGVDHLQFSRQQANNRRNNTVLKFQGEEHTEAEWARILGVKKSLISNRLARGWSVEDTLTKEVQYNARWAK